MEYDGDVLRVSRAPLAATLHLVLVDLRASKDTVAILAGLQAAYPHPATAAERAAVRLFGEVNEDITRRAERAMAEGDCEALGTSVFLSYFMHRLVCCCGEWGRMERMHAWDGLKPFPTAAPTIQVGSSPLPFPLIGGSPPRLPHLLCSTMQACS
jgi:hypothetical protein